MSVKNVLVFIKKGELNNAGGPSGYNFNLLDGLNKIGAQNVFFLEDETSKSESKIEIIKKNKSSIACKLLYNKFFRSLHRGFKHISLYFNTIIKNEKNKVDFNKFDVIHFHSTFDLYRNLKKLKSFKGIILLTTHAPVLPSVELKNEFEKWTRIVFFYLYLFGKHIDIIAMKKANYILTPCKNAMDAYSNYSKKFEKIVSNKLVYVPTGCINQYETNEENENRIRNLYHLDKRNFNIVYLGRHNSVKGYDTLKKFGIKLNEINSNYKFIVGGRLGAIKPPKIDTWTELGFTKDALEITRFADVYVSCNKETYFDLATIQALSVGTFVLTTRVGGNKYFEEEKIPGVFLFDDFNEFYEALQKINALKLNEKLELKEKVKKCFLEKFDSRVFAKNYIDLINKL